ncbi:23692_t:CDS:2, partial [Racocetra persica]
LLVALSVAIAIPLERRTTKFDQCYTSKSVNATILDVRVSPNPPTILLYMFLVPNVNKVGDLFKVICKHKPIPKKKSTSFELTVFALFQYTTLGCARHSFYF